MSAVIGRQVKALMAFAIGTVAVGLPTFDRTHDEGGTDDVVQWWDGVQDLFPAIFQGAGSYLFVGVLNLIISIHNKIIS